MTERKRYSDPAADPFAAEPNARFDRADANAADRDSDEFDPAEFDPEDRAGLGADLDSELDPELDGLESGADPLAGTGARRQRSGAVTTTADTTTDAFTDTTTGTSAGAQAVADSADARAIDDADVATMTQRWREIQAGFVDEPRRAVQDADALVSEVLDQMTQRLAEQCRRLESSWQNGERASTEDLRVSMQGYRVLFERLLSV